MSPRPEREVVARPNSRRRYPPSQAGCWLQITRILSSAGPRVKRSFSDRLSPKSRITYAGRRTFLFRSARPGRDASRGRAPQAAGNCVRSSTASLGSSKQRMLPARAHAPPNAQCSKNSEPGQWRASAGRQVCAGDGAEQSLQRASAADRLPGRLLVGAVIALGANIRR